jgi:hypothetical protein
MTLWQNLYIVFACVFLAVLYGVLLGSLDLSPPSPRTTWSPRPRS